jgi:hypothetical protein
VKKASKVVSVADMPITIASVSVTIVKGIAVLWYRPSNSLSGHYIPFSYDEWEESEDGLWEDLLAGTLSDLYRPPDYVLSVHSLTFTVLFIRFLFFTSKDFLPIVKLGTESRTTLMVNMGRRY